MSTFHLIPNIFTKKQRKEIIKKVQPFLIDGLEYSKEICEENPQYGIGYSEGFTWNKKTHIDLPYNPQFLNEHRIFLKTIAEKTDLKLGLVRSWINLTAGKKEKLTWHNHCYGKPINDPSVYGYSGVYYLKSLPFRDGTLFKDHGFVQAPENSLLLFPSHVPHCTPASRLRFHRYSWAMDLTYVNK